MAKEVEIAELPLSPAAAAVYDRINGTKFRPDLRGIAVETGKLLLTHQIIPEEHEYLNDTLRARKGQLKATREQLQPPDLPEVIDLRPDSVISPMPVTPLAPDAEAPRALDWGERSQPTGSREL
jgi:hypothetical protein